MNHSEESREPNELKLVELGKGSDASNIVASGGQVFRSTEKDIADMRARIESLSAQIRKITLEPSSKPLFDKLAHELREANRKLTEYQSHLKGPN